ncbi:MAG: hypothetical protein C0392_15410 [Syntrophus sp. (in: bacteria)]|nr:hypothetical protein [Syntrophus sp. (in: bacteria)]
MGKFITAGEAIQILNKEDFELLDFMKQGSLNAYTEDGKRVVDSDTLEYGRKETLEEIRTMIRAKIKTPFRSLGDIGDQSINYSHLTPEMNELRLLFNTKPTSVVHSSNSLNNDDFDLDDYVDKLAKFGYEQQPLDVMLNPPENSYCMSFTQTDTKLVIATIMSFKFIRREVVALRNTESDGPDSLPQIENITPTPIPPMEPSSLQQAVLPTEKFLQANEAKPTSEKPLTGYKEIANHFGMKADAVRKTFKNQGCPIYFDTNNRVYAYPSELNQWRDGRSKRNNKRK